MALPEWVIWLLVIVVLVPAFGFFLALFYAVIHSFYLKRSHEEEIACDAAIRSLRDEEERG